MSSFGWRFARLTLPSQSKCWLPESQQFFKYQPYNFTLSAEKNSSFIKNNQLFLKTLHYLLSCNYHQFWCLVLFEPKIAICLHSFLLNPIVPYQIKNLDEEAASVYLQVFSQLRRVYQRLTTFQETEVDLFHIKNKCKQPDFRMSIWMIV